MTPIKDRIREIKTNGYQLDFGNVFEKAFENYKKIALYAGLMLLVFTILFGILIVGIIMIAAISIFNINISTLTEMLKPENLKPENLSINFILIYSALIVGFTSLLSPFQAGFLKMADCGEKGEEFHVSTIFEYYKSPYFKEIFISTLLISLIGSGLSILLDYSGIQFIGTFVSIMISFLTFLTIPLVVFGKLKAVDAINSSITIVVKQPLQLFGLVVVAGIASMTGLIVFCLGIFFTIPFIYSMYYAIYSSIIGIDSESELKKSDLIL